MSEDLGQTHSPWPKRLLITGIIAFILGAVGLGYTLPSISDGLIPDNFNDAVIEPGATVEVNLTGLRVYSLFQNTTDKLIITHNNTYLNTNLVSNSGVVATDTTGVGTARSDVAACSYN